MSLLQILDDGEYVLSVGESLEYPVIIVKLDQIFIKFSTYQKVLLYIDRIWSRSQLRLEANLNRATTSKQEPDVMPPRPESQP